MNKTLTRVAKGLAKSLSVPLLLILIAPLSSANATMATDMTQANKQAELAIQAKAVDVSSDSKKLSTVSKSVTNKRRVASKAKFKAKSAAASKTRQSDMVDTGVALKTSPALTVMVANPVPLQQNPLQYMPAVSAVAPVVAASATVAQSTQIPASRSYQPSWPAQQVQASRVNPYLVNMPVPGQAVAAQQQPQQPQQQAAAPLLTMPKFSLPDLSLPNLPLFQEEILPKVSKVYPTGEKPLVVVSFKCPTELIGIDTPSTKLLHMGIEGGMDLVNKTNMLSFNMQSVCR